MGMFDAPQSLFADDQVGGPLANLLGDYLRNVFTGQIAANGVLANNYYDPGRSFAQNALDPRAIQQAADIAAGVMGNGLGIRAYHGSPYDFDAFDASKIGTGEGAQAYGHGLYFAESEPVAQSYRNTLSPSPYGTYGGQQIIGHPDLSLAQQQAAWDLSSYMKKMNASPEAARDYWIRRIKSNGGDASIFESLNPEKFENITPGRMYEVNINADPNAFLDWDKPLSGQPHVQAAFDSLGATPGPRWEVLSNAPLATGAARMSPAEASQALNQAGIPGIRYLDQGSRGAGEGTSNYVVFDPSIVEILRKYGLIGPVVPGSLAPYAFGDNTQ